MTTPWGPAQQEEKLAPGITEVSTAGHGGIHLIPTVNALVHRVWRERSGWYEEDCDWAIVALTFPELFPAQRAAYAHDSAKRWHAKSYAVAMGVATPETVSVGDCPSCGKHYEWHGGWKQLSCGEKTCDATVPLRDEVRIHNPDGTTTVAKQNTTPTGPEKQGAVRLPSGAGQSPATKPSLEGNTTVSNNNISVAYAGDPEILLPGTEYGYDTLGDAEYGAKLRDVVIVGEPDELRNYGRKLIGHMDRVAPGEETSLADAAQTLAHEQGWSFEALTSLAYDFLLEADKPVRDAFLAYLRDAAENENDDPSVVAASPAVDG
ncbi:DUF7007 domain-containing protein [Micromonospora arborensis]|uniref:DUF7007 domain-containing protein n=1 Tax=Micromonospora arborensis TaxID=2116518 RepID=UPI00371B38D2